MPNAIEPDDLVEMLTGVTIKEIGFDGSELQIIFTDDRALRVVGEELEVSLGRTVQ